MSKDKKGFTLVELMIVIAVLAILASIVLFALNPAEVFKKTRDAQRLSDLRTLSGAITYYISLGNTICQAGTNGTEDTAYLSVTPTTGWTCAAASTITGSDITLVDGTGWIPINFGTDAAVGSLPIDPINTTSYTYAFGCTSASDFKIMTAMESTAYANGGDNDKESTDGGTNDYALETGTNLADIMETDDACGWSS
jgi:prepilin-type N-terminal cleavage/methylation domain-containing protein